jgi:hypothetical protein
MVPLGFKGLRKRRASEENKDIKQEVLGRASSLTSLHKFFI